MKEITNHSSKEYIQETKKKIRNEMKIEYYNSQIPALKSQLEAEELIFRDIRKKIEAEKENEKDLQGKLCVQTKEIKELKEELENLERDESSLSAEIDSRIAVNQGLMSSFEQIMQ